MIYTMALNIKNDEVEQLAREVSQITGESKTEAIRVALKQRRESLVAGSSRAQGLQRLQAFLANEIWPQVPAETRKKPLSKEERETILGYGNEGV